MKGKTAVITGASSGIGNEISFTLAKMGVNLAILARRNDKLTTIAKELEKTGVTVKPYACDVSDRVRVTATFEAIAADFGEIDFLVNNAGTSTRVQQADLDQITEAADKDYAVNVRGTIMCCMAAYPLMKNGGAIVNISSIRGRTGTPSLSIGYSAAKSGIINLTKTFAQRLAEYNIRVNCVAPGAIYPTEMSKFWNDDVQQRIIDSSLAKRLGTPKDIANVVYFLLSDLSSFITGQTIDVNGGVWLN